MQPFPLFPVLLLLSSSTPIAKADHPFSGPSVNWSTLRDELNHLYPPFYLSSSQNGRHPSGLLASALVKTAIGTEEAIRWLTLSAMSAGNASSSLAIGTFASFLLHALHATGEQNSDGSSARRVLRAIDLMRSGLPLEALLTSGWPVFSMLMHFRSVVDAAGLESDSVCAAGSWDLLSEGLESIDSVARHEGISVSLANHLMEMASNISVVSQGLTIGKINECPPGSMAALTLWLLAALGSGVPDLPRILQTYVSIADALWQFMTIEQLTSTRWRILELLQLLAAQALKRQQQAVSESAFRDKYKDWDAQFTVLITTISRTRTVNVNRVIQLFKTEPAVREIIVLWNNGEQDPPSFANSSLVPVRVITQPNKNISNRWKVAACESKTPLVFNVDDDIVFDVADILRMFLVARAYPNTVVGTMGRFFDLQSRQYSFRGWPLFNIVLPGFAFIGVETLREFVHERELLKYFDADDAHCDDISLNWFISIKKNQTLIAVPGVRVGDAPQASEAGALSMHKDRRALRSRCCEWILNYFRSNHLKFGRWVSSYPDVA
mmetsp:Transcript_6462/g.15610  ORF Transcript_6462/g.15610 Transcript_6462/m.15610 type:complete len:552 (+) Transcript_6462:265-1920(+)